MSKNSTNTNANALQTVKETQDLSQANEAFFDALEKVSESELSPLDAEYLEFNAGDIQNLIFTGIETGNFADGSKDIAIFQGRNGWKYANGNSVIVNSMKKITPPAPVRIVCTGEQKATSGQKYKTFKIYTL